MKYLFKWSLLLASLVSVSCGIAKKNVIDKRVSALEKENIKEQVVLSDDQQRKFNYFFYEGNRYKALGEAQKSFMYYSEALKVDTTCAVCHYELARLLLSSQSFDDAEKLLVKAVELSPSNSWYIELLSRVLQNNKNGDKAIKYASKLLEGSSPSPENIYFVAQLQEENERYEEAIESLLRMESIMGFSEGLVLERYQLYLKNEDYKSAEKVLKTLIKKYPGNPDYLVYLGDFYLGRKKLDQAWEEYEESRKIEPQNGKVFFSLANFYLQKKDIENFKEMFLDAFKAGNVDFDSKFQRFIPFLMGMDDKTNPLDSVDFDNIFNVLLTTHPFEPKVYVSYGNFLIAGKANEKAAGFFQKALEIDAQQKEVWQDYLFLLSGMGDNDKLLNKTQEAMKFFPENPVFYLFQGVSLFQEEKLDGALAALEKGLEYVGDNKDLKGQFYAYIGDIYYSLEDTHKSFASYDKALEIDENNLLVLNNYSYYLSLLGINLERAEKMSAKTVELDPGNSTYLDTYAWVLFKRGRYLEAKFIIERAIDNNLDSSGVIMEHYGDILFMSGDEKEALNVWKKALKMGNYSDILPKKIAEERFIDGE